MVNICNYNLSKGGGSLGRRRKQAPIDFDTLSTPNTQNGANINFAKLAKVIIADLNANSKTQVFFSKFVRTDVVKYLASPDIYSAKIREMSNYLYIISSHYRRLINYISKLYLLDYVIEPYYISPTFNNDRTFAVTYANILSDVERMNIKHEMMKAQVLAWRNDVYFGYIMETKDSFYIKNLDPMYCQISSVEDGCYCFSFNFAYFDGKTESHFLTFPEEFATLYQQYKKNTTVKWLELDPKYTFCLKVNEDISYPVVPFCGVFEALYDIEEYKSLKKAKTAIGNYKFLSMIMPLKDDTNTENPYKLDPSELTKYYNFIANLLPEEIGLLLSPTDLKEFSFDKETVHSDKVVESTTQFWDTAGVSELLMSGRNATGASLAKSVTTDEAMAGSLITQIERNINRRIKKYNADQYKFKLRFLPTTVFNYQDIHDMYVKASSLGFPTKIAAAASLGITQGAMSGMLYLENTILQLPTTMVPVQNSNTMASGTGTGEAGAPKKKADKLSPEGENAQANDTNNPDSRNFDKFEESLDDIID